MSKHVNTPEPFTPDKTLSLFVDCDMTKYSHQTVRSAAERKQAEIYPSYNNIGEAKNKCYPENVVINETSAEVPLQNLLDLTAIRIIREEKESKLLQL